MDRRFFLKAAAAGTMAGLCAPLIGCGSSAPATSAGVLSGPAGSRTLPRVGVQLYTVRNLMQQDFEGTLRKVAQIGYKEVEFAGLYERKATDVRRLLDELGMTAPSSHIGQNLIRENLDAVIADAKVLGQKYIIIPYHDQTQRSAEGYRGLANLLNTAGKQVRDAGMKMAYHNHDFEFDTVGGKVAYDLLLEETDPALVTFEMDMFWTKAAGKDPIAYFNKYPGRFELVHVKDRTVGGDMVSVGHGVMDFRSLFAMSEKAGIRHYVVEHDQPTDALQSITESYQYLAALKF